MTDIRSYNTLYREVFIINQNNLFSLHKVMGGEIEHFGVYWGCFITLFLVFYEWYFIKSDLHVADDDN